MNVQETRYWVQSHPRITDEQRRLIFAALDSFELLVGTPTVSPEDLAAIMEAARCPWVAVGDIGGRALAELAGRHQAAQDAFRVMIASRKSSERLQAVDHLSARMPTSLNQEILRRGINDRSKSVRLCAARKCDRLHLREMLPELEQRVEVEPAPELKQRLEFHIAMIRDGYLIERKEDGEIQLCVRKRNGWSWQEISQEDIDNGRVLSLVAEEQAKLY
jgi:hypothetical protein